MTNNFHNPFLIPDSDIRKRLLRPMAAHCNPESLRVVESAAKLIEVSLRIQEALTRHFQRYGLSQSRFVILLAMASGGQESYSPLELARRIGVKPPTMTGILDGMEREGLVIRTQEESDRRKNLVVLTVKGQRTFQKIFPDHVSRIASAFGYFVEMDRNGELDALVQHVQESIGKLTGE